METIEQVKEYLKERIETLDRIIMNYRKQQEFSLAASFSETRYELKTVLEHIEKTNNAEERYKLQEKKLKRKNTVWKKSDIKKLMKMYRKNISMAEIAKEFDTSIKSVERKIYYEKHWK